MPSPFCLLGLCGLRLLLRHERILVIARRRERLLERARVDPADEVQLRAGLVVGAGSARAAERLLADDRTGRLVVDVEVARGVPQRARRFAHRLAVAAEDGARSTRTARSGRRRQRLVPLRVGVDVGRDDRSEDLLAHACGSRGPRSGSAWAR